MAERSLRIQAFRNIGFKDDSPWHERLVINNSLKKGNLGDLRIIIGANNSGKSNILGALDVITNTEFSERDVTDLFLGDNCRAPEVTLFVRDDGDKEDKFAYKIDNENEISIVTPDTSNDEYTFCHLTKENIIGELSAVSKYETAHLQRGDLAELYNANSDKGVLTEEEFKELGTRIFNILDNYKNNHHGFSVLPFFRAIENTKIWHEYVNFDNLSAESKDSAEEINKKYRNAYGYNFIPNVLPYNEQQIKNENLSTDYDSIENNPFFTALLNSIGVEPSYLQKIRKEFVARRNMSALKEITKKLNTKLSTVSDKFNRLYYLEKEPYSFEIDLQDKKIYFCLYKGGRAIQIDYQSTGFRWFFNLFFNLLNSTNLNPGDIITMDEPATNLHVKGQRELRGFLKEFAIQNDITIIVVTHSPFLIDMDNLDEIRIVINENNISRIENNFSAAFKGDPDSLRAIKESLTIENHILVDPDETVVFVEGITDYNYLTAFKKILNRKNITFLPINGVGENKKDCESTSTELLRIRKHDPILLVDNDNAGQLMKGVNEKDSALKVISLDEIGQDFKTIESLFAETDLKKYGLIDENLRYIKHASTSSVFKNHVKTSDLCKETLANFTKLFNYLENQTK